MKTLAKWLILVSLPLVFAVLCVLGYYAWGKVSYAGTSCGSFAAVDDEIGWVLKPAATSCLGARAPFGDGTPWFQSSVHTDANGFRAAANGGPTPVGGIFAIGDSWTFGFGVDYSDSYPGQLAGAAGLPVVTVASPAYSSAQAILLAERWAPRLRPRALVYLDNGFWNRAACRGPNRPEAILKPCYWPAPGSAEAELVLPPPGRVSRMAAFGVLPGGVLGAGELGWSYFLVSRPLALVTQGLVRTGMASGFAHDFQAVGVDETAIRRATLRHLARLATDAGAPLLLLDPGNAYGSLLAALPAVEAAAIHHVTGSEWSKAVDEPAAQLPPALARVPNDGHYGPGTNKLIAALVAAKLRQLGVGG